MLPDSIHDGLRARLTADFNALTHGATDAAEISKILHELIHTTNGILCDLASTWSESHNLARRLPPEMLSSCFMMLDEFTDRIAVSHVSRAWRSAALAHPAIWADLDFTAYGFRDELALLQMALSRTGRYPVKLWAPETDSTDVMASCLTQHMNHIGELVLTSLDPLVSALCLPAPMLKTLSGMCNSWAVPENFLDARVGKLASLNLPAVSFPPTCPALSTVTSLMLTFPSYPEQAATYTQLFQLFPVLRSLSLSHLRLDFSESLPRGPAPPTLDKLELQTLDPHHDLIAIYVDWQHENNLRDVRLEVDGSTAVECNLQAFVTGAFDLTVLMTGGPHEPITTIMARCTGQRTRDLEFYDADYDGHDAAELIARAQSALGGVRAFTLPANTLDAFIEQDVFTSFPKLTHLTITIEGSSQHEFQWGWLVSLPRVLDARPRLKSILISVACDLDEDEKPLVEEDARALLAVLEQIASGLPSIRITGFTRDAVRDMQVRPDVKIQFDTSP